MVLNVVLVFLGFSGQYSKKFSNICQDRKRSANPNQNQGSLLSQVKVRDQPKPAQF